MDSYIAGMDEANRIAAVWIKRRAACGPNVFDPKKRIFDPRQLAEFSGAPREDIVSWLDTTNQRVNPQRSQPKIAYATLLAEMPFR